MRENLLIVRLLPDEMALLDAAARRFNVTRPVMARRILAALTDAIVRSEAEGEVEFEFRGEAAGVQS